MIRFTAQTKDGRTILGMGLSEVNLRRLMEGQPIRFGTADLNGEGQPELQDIEVFIFAGTTEEAMAAQLESVRPVERRDHIVTHLQTSDADPTPWCGAPGPVRPPIPKGRGTVLCTDCIAKAEEPPP